MVPRTVLTIFCITSAFPPFSAFVTGMVPLSPIHSFELSNVLYSVRFFQRLKFVNIWGDQIILHTHERPYSQIRPKCVISRNQCSTRILGSPVFGNSISPTQSGILSYVFAAISSKIVGTILRRRQRLSLAL